ncbi:hypothetical protein, partial [Salmonella sp. s54836]|uniref:hypothetical protein n=1 Tax=Salmonella sp. s54836 TaxID=3159673 RepID=UPI0039808BBA
QGQLGFGVQAGQIGRDFRAAQLRGTPYPILWILEYFTLDGEQIRWGRKYRTGGWYVHIIMWLCLPIWALMCVLYLFNIRAASCLIVIIGFLMVLGIIIWSANITNFPEIEFPFESGILTLHFGWTWYLTLFTGIFAFAFGAITIIADFFFPRHTATFFGIDPL